MQPQQQELAITRNTAVQPATAPRRTPMLESGDHLTRHEFERRYEAMPEVKKVELIEGVVYMPSPVRFDQHGSPHAALVGWLVAYWANTPGVRAGDNASLRLDLDNEPQPDAMLIVEPSQGGQARIDEEGYIAGGPELVAEVAASTVSLARNSKLRVYRRNNVREYLIWRTDDQALDWFVLREGQYQSLPRRADGLLCSEQFPGLWLDADALLRFDLARVLQVVQQGLANSEHAAFAAQLRERTGNLS